VSTDIVVGVGWAKVGAVKKVAINRQPIAILIGPSWPIEGPIQSLVTLMTELGGGFRDGGIRAIGSALQIECHKNDEQRVSQVWRGG
jgi:hypothetical protein